MASLSVHRRNHNPTTSSSATPQTPPSSVFPSDDGRLYVSPQDTEADLGLQPLTSDTQPISVQPPASMISTTIFEEPENVTGNAGDGVSAATTSHSVNLETSRLGGDGARRRDTVEYRS